MGQREKEARRCRGADGAVPLRVEPARLLHVSSTLDPASRPGTCCTSAVPFLVEAAAESCVAHSELPVGAGCSMRRALLTSRTRVVSLVEVRVLMQGIRHRI